MPLSHNQGYLVPDTSYRAVEATKNRNEKLIGKRERAQRALMSKQVRQTVVGKEKDGKPKLQESFSGQTLSSAAKQYTLLRFHPTVVAL